MDRRITYGYTTMLQLTKEMKRPVSEVISELIRLTGADQVCGMKQ